MGGGLMQLVAYGAQDVYLTGNPQITFFKVVYRRHTNFATEQVEQELNGNVNWGSNISSVISRTGDLLYRMNLEWICPTDDDLSQEEDLFIIPHNFGHYMIDHVTLQIGGQDIDKLYGHWMEVYSRLTIPNPSKTIGFFSKDMINSASDFPNNNNYDQYMKNSYSKKTIDLSDLKSNGTTQNTNYQQMAGASGCSGGLIKGLSNLPQRLQIPLPFWFCRNPGLALPIIALQYHDVRLKIKLNDNFSSTYYTNGSNKPTDDGDQSNTLKTFSDIIFKKDNLKLWCEYIYLDTDERRRFAQVSHEYLIEQVQREEKTIPNQSNKIDISLNKFNHPIKSLIICGDWGKNDDVTNMFPDTQTSVPYNTPWWDVNINAEDKKFNLDLDVIKVVNDDGSIQKNTPNYSTTTINPPTNWNGPVGIYQRYSIPGWLPGIGDHNTSLSLSFNGHNRFNENKPWYYFSRYQTQTHFSGPSNLYTWNLSLVGGEGHYQNGGRANTMDNLDPLNKVSDSIGVYNFALKPEEHQPSGTCNFSRIDNCKLTIQNICINPTIDTIKKANSMYNDSNGTIVTDNSKYYPNKQTYFCPKDSGWKNEQYWGNSIMKDIPYRRIPIGKVLQNKTKQMDWSVNTDDKYSNLPKSSVIFVYALNYNVLRIMSGMGGLAYSN